MTCASSSSKLSVPLAVGLLAVLPTASESSVIGLSGRATTVWGTPNFASTDLTTSTLFTPSTLPLLQDDKTLPDSGFDAARIVGQVKYGELRVAASSASQCEGGRCGVGTAEMTAFTRDALTIGGAASGYIGFSVSLDGSLWLSGENFGIGAQSAVGYTLRGTGGEFYAYANVIPTGPGSSFIGTHGENPSYGVVPDITSSFSANYSYAVGGRVYIPFAGPYFALYQELFVRANCYSVNVVTNACGAESDFSHTVRLGGAAIYDSSLNPIQGFSIVSESGYDYTQPLPGASAVPEPTSMILLGGGLIGLTRVRRRT